MAASLSSVQSILSLPATTRVGQKSRGDMMVSSMRLPRQQKSGGMQVRCMAGDKLPEQPTPQVPPPSPKAKKVSSFREVLAFSGPAPERINGRLAMVGFVTAIAVELVKGDDVVDQLANGGLPWFAYVSVLFSLASLVPLLSGVSVESKSKGFMTSNAELWNGRFAMLGLVGLVLTEFVKGGALV